jgi:hypothetical protein
MTAITTRADIPAGTLVVVARGRQGEQIARTCTPCYGPGRWPFVRRWMGAKWTDQPCKARVLRLATAEDLTLLAPGAGAEAARLWVRPTLGPVTDPRTTSARKVG